MLDLRRTSSFSWCRRVLALVLLFLALEAAASSSPSSDSASTYHSSVSEVRLVLFATDEQNHPVENLKQEDFAVVDNELVIRNFRGFYRSKEYKLDVIILLDASESNLPQFRKQVTEVKQLIAKWPWAAEDRVSLISFAGMGTDIICTENCRAPLPSADGIASHFRGGATPLYDAVFLAANTLALRHQPDVWPVIILFSDGKENVSLRSLNGALEAVLASGAQIYSIDTGDSRQQSPATSVLQRLADDSGGRHLSLSDGSPALLRNILDDLHAARVVIYPLPHSLNDFHSVRILPTRNLKLHFRCRSGYFQRPYGPAKGEF